MTKLNFLCPKHRSELINHPAKAIAFWQKGFDTGQFYCDKEQWHDAIPHLGCAYESAEIMLTSQAIDTRSAYEILTESAILLANSFNYVRFKESALTVFSLTINRLERELHFNPHSAIDIQPHLQALCSIRHLSCPVHEMPTLSQLH